MIRTKAHGFAISSIAAVTMLSLAACNASEDVPWQEYAVAKAHPAVKKSVRCDNYRPERQALWGDIHVHTSYSSDAWMFDVRLKPDDAYRYGFGESVLLPPNDVNGKPTRSVNIDRPLDFVAVTDHAEFLAEQSFCVDPKSSHYEDKLCKSIRENRGRSIPLAMRIMLPFTWREDDMCGEDGAQCRARAKPLWQDTVAAAEKWNDYSAECERTAFIAYEYSSFRMGSNLHRNVIFKNNVVPELPISYIEAPREWTLWEKLKSGCKDSGAGCDVLAIPHNSNISNGQMFSVQYPHIGTNAEQAARARLRMEMEPVYELMQHKGDSECRADGVPNVLAANDELCGFEKFETMSTDMRGEKPGLNTKDNVCGEGFVANNRPYLGPSCISHLNYARSALVEGLKEEQRIGVNPFKFGLTAATDTHNAIAGGVQEKNFPGHLGIGDDTVAKRVSYNTEWEGNTSNGPGGLTAVWAEQNNRASIFEAMQRKEVFGTSGPRIQPRLFGGWNFSADLCNESERVRHAYANGVPMGGDLSNAAEGAAPTFLISALADTGTAEFPGNPLQRLQIIKGWVGENGDRNEKVFDVAGNRDNGASVDVDTCETSGSGFTQLCSVWADPEFDPKLHAVYYARAVENPSCRYNAWQCVGLEGDERPEGCDEPAAPKVIQERAWTSPIWYTPG